MVERTEARDESIRVLAPLARGQNVSARGEDICRGAVVVRSGDVLTPGRIGVLAAIGEARVRVYARPKVAILTTGDEVVRPGARIRAGQVYDINSQTLATLVRDHGGAPVLRGRTKDRIASLRAAVRDAARSADLVVVSGGSSVGSRDLLVDVLDEVLFHGIAVKPGRPTILGRAGRRTVLGMPGYPTSCLSNGYVLLVPMLRRLARLPPSVDRAVDVPLAERIDSPAGKVEVHTVRIAEGRALSAWKESSTITSMSEADGYIVIPADITVLEAGTRVRVILF
jgi:molybdenum cofactor synthesis domain-containing protein